MKIKVTSVYVDDQDKALRCYTEILGFAKKTDFSQGPFRRGAEFTLPPREVTASKIAMLNDTRVNLIQVTQLMRW